MRRYIALFVVLFVFISLIFLIKPGISQNTSRTNSVVFHMIVKNNKVISGQTTLRVHKGDDVSIIITADVDGKLQLHGYKKVISFIKNRPAVLSFQANISGRFPYELEDTDAEIGVLEVYPR